jgi:hypothetical protein
LIFGKLIESGYRAEFVAHGLACVTNQIVFHSRVMDYMNLEEEFGEEKNSKGAKRRKKARGRESHSCSVECSSMPPAAYLRRFISLG